MIDVVIIIIYMSYVYKFINQFRILHEIVSIKSDDEIKCPVKI